MANAKRTLKLRTYTIVSDAIESSIGVGLDRAYKHSDRRLSDFQREHITENVARAIMENLDDIIDWGDDNND
jgi:hypothetical protein